MLFVRVSRTMFLALRFILRAGIICSKFLFVFCHAGRKPAAAMMIASLRNKISIKSRIEVRDSCEYAILIVNHISCVTEKAWYLA